MLSIIICSVNTFSVNSIKKNIEETVGVPHELIIIDNSNNQYGICRAYNEGGGRAQYPYLCFMHEDVYFETRNWGQLVCKYLADEKVGLLGVAGGDSKSRVPSSWSVPVMSNEINLVQHYKAGEKPAERLYITHSADKTGIKKVVALDGVWLCTKKKVFEDFRFDEINFPGFHGYDIDYSLQVNTKYNNYVCFDILIHHYSEGKPDRKWVESAIRVSNKWKKNLPCSVYPLTHDQLAWHHWHSLRVFLQHLFRLEYNFTTILLTWLKWSFAGYFSARRFLSMGRYIFGSK